jgi:triosephosphate isomerase
MRKMIIAGNWKMNKCKEEAIKFIFQINNKIPKRTKIETIIFPQITLLDSLTQIEGENLRIGAQNVFYENQGPYTGEISPINLKSLGIKYVILGHKERRILFGETDKIVNLKLLSVLSQQMYPIVCVGEHLEIRNKQETKLFLKNQIYEIFKNIPEQNMKNIIIAYEPFWAINTTNQNLDPKEKNKIIKNIRETINLIFSKKISEQIRIIYGGSVNMDNIENLLKQKEIDGVLIGQNSLKVENFLFCIEIAKKIKKNNI